MEIDYPDDALGEIAKVLGASSLMGAYDYGLGLYFSHLRTARDYLGGVLGVYSIQENKFYRN